MHLLFEILLLNLCFFIFLFLHEALHFLDPPDLHLVDLLQFLQVLIFLLVLQNETAHLLIQNAFDCSGEHLSDAELEDVRHLGEHANVREVSHIDAAFVHNLR